MGTWLMIVDVVRAMLFSTAHLFGGSLGAGILAVSLVVRIALLPFTLRLARQALEHQRRMAKLAPALEKLRKRHSGDSARLGEATLALYRREGVAPVPPGTLRGMLVQLPINAALYQAIARGLGRSSSWLWVADLAKPDAIVAAVAAVLAGAAVATGTPSSRSALMVSSLITFAIAWRLSAGVGLYWVASNAVSVGQGLILRRTQAETAR